MKSHRFIPLALLACACVSFAWGEDPKREYTQTIEHTLPLDSGATFSISNKNGSIDVSTWDKDEVHIVAEKVMRLERGGWWIARFLGIRQRTIESDDDAQKLFDEFAMEMTGDTGSRTVTTLYPKSASNVSFRMHYRVTLPAEIDLAAKSVNGNVRAQDIDGLVNLATTNGKINTKRTNGPLTTSTTNGRIELDDASGRLEARTTNGSIAIALLPDAPIGDNITCRTVNGSIRLNAPDAAAFELHARTVNGSIRTELPVTHTETKSRKRLEGSINGGGPTVELRTTNGSIRIEPNG